MKKGFTTFLSALKANTPPCKKGLSSLRFLSLFLILFLGIGQMLATSYIPGTKKTVTANETIDYATIAGANATTSGKWIVNPRGGTTSGKKYTNLTSDTKGNPGGIVDNIATITSNVNMATIQVPSTAKYNQNGKYVIHMRITGITGIIAHGVTGSSGRGCAIYGQEYSTSLTENTEYGSALASMTRSGNSGSFLLQYTGFTASKEYLITIAATGGDDQLYAIELIAPSTPVCPSGLTISSKNDKTAFYTGDAIELTAALSEGNGAITYQWYKGGTAEENKLIGQTAAKLEIASCAEGDAGDYYCVASKADCPDAVNADAFTITVTPSPCVTVTGAEQFVVDYTINGAYAINSGCATNNGALKIDNGSDFVEIYAPAGKKISLIEMSLYAGADKKVGYGFGASAVVDNDLMPWDWATKDVTGSYADYEFEPISSGKAKYFRLYRKVNVDAVDYGSGTSTFINRICVTLENTVAYAITYNLNGGTGTTPMESNKEAGTVVTLASGTSGITPPTDKKFNGWLVKDATDATVTVTDGKFTMPTSEVTITAQWADVFAVTYAKGDEGASGEMTDSNSPYVAGAEVILLANAFTPPTGKEFDAWVVTEIESGDPVAVSENKFTMPAAAVTVKATWKDACALDPTVSATTLGTTSYTTQVVNCAGISVLGSAGCTISEYGFVYGTATAPTISDNKKALEGDYTVAGTAFAETTLSGLASNTTYYVRAFATNSHGTAYGDEISFTTLAPLGNVLVVANSASQTSDAITALSDNGFIVTVSAPNNSRGYTGYDLVVLDESLSGNNGVAGKEEGDIKDVNIPLLNLKSFFYNSGRWGWGTGNNGTADNEIAKIPATYKNAQSHPIFAGLTITDGNIDLIDPAKTGNTLQTATGLAAGKEGYVLATVGGNAFIHELTPAQRGVTDAKYLMVAISNNAKDNLSADGELLIVNAAKYLLGSTAWVPQYYTVSFDPHGGDPIAPRTGNPGITLPETEYGTQSFLGWFTEEAGGTKIGEAGDFYTPTADITLHAQWEAVSTDARLASITFSSDAGTLSPAFDPEVTNYTYTMPYSTAAVPTITSATSVSAKAQEPQIVSQASAWGETAVIRGVAESSDTKAYNITMLRAPKDGACIFKAELTSATAAEYSGIYADATNSKINLSNDGDKGYKFAGKSNYIQMALTGGTFAEGDILHMTYKTVPTQGELAIYNNTTKIVGTSYVNSTLEFPVGAAGLSTLYIRRTEDNNFNGWVTMVEVTRIMNPMLTAITFDGVAGVIDEANKKVTVELPFSSDVASMIVEPTIAWNAPAATNAIVVNDGSDWGVGDNTYVLTDKDGDQTTYTITLTQAAASADATLKTLTINGNALTLVDGVYEYDYELPYGTTTAPTVEAETNDANANAVVTSVSLTEAVITVTAENGATQEYVINFTISPWQNIVIWDGSTMDAVAASPDASGLTWEVKGFKSIAEYTTTCGSKTYSKVLPSGGSASDSRNFKIVIPDGYLAKFYIAFASHEEGTSRGMSIGTTINKNSDTSIYGAECSTRSEALGGTSVIVGAGTYYINPIASIDFCEVSVLLRPGYIRPGLTVGSLGTICLPSNVPAGQASGATFYKLVGKEPQYGKIVFDEILSGELEAGKPYLFQANAAEIVCYYGTTSVPSPDNTGAMKGTFVDLELDELSNIYYFADRALWSCVDLTELSVPANRAYVDMDDMPAISESNPAPGVRRITLGVNGQQVATGVDQVQGDNVPTKMIINGQLFILRGEKMYDAQGKLVR